jgi:carbamoyl-phosphate synthase small subunit
VAKEIINNKPLFGICLGHQIIGLANGISTYKMFNGHRGINHPVKNLISGKGEITSQNHGFAVNKDELEANSDLEITHVHLNDGTVAGMRMKYKNCFSVQYHPEASPGPHDSSYLFDQFIQNLKKDTYSFINTSRGFLINLRKPPCFIEVKKVFCFSLHCFLSQDVDMAL